MPNIEEEVSQLIVDVLNLEHIAAEEINPNASLFGEGLGLDSIDALELSLALSQRYGIEIDGESKEINQIFSSVRALARHIESNRKD